MSFKDSFKYYKSKKPPPDLDGVIDLDRPDRHPAALVPITLDHRPPNSSCRLRRDCLPPAAWRCYRLAGRPGVLFVRNPFTERGQRYWMARSLRDYPRHPHATNLRATGAGTEAEEEEVEAEADSEVGRGDDATTHSGRQPPPPPTAAQLDWWRQLHQLPADSVERRRLRAAMRWTTLGYHHNWDTKRYSERERHPFPADLAELCAYVAQVVLAGDGSEGGHFEAQAAIVNFYPQGTQLAGHTDHSERELEAPLLSFSFGQSAIFLIGGPTLDVRPDAVFLRSGDICVMSRQSRLSYHAVPRILHGADANCWLTAAADDAEEETQSNSSEAIEEVTTDCNTDDEPPQPKRRKSTANVDEGAMLADQLDDALWADVRRPEWWRPFDDYVTDCRINVNVRQVLPAGVRTLAEADAALDAQK